MKPAAAAIVAQFRREHPECESGFGVDPIIGLTMNTETVKKFSAWCVEKGHTTMHHAENLDAAMKRTIEEAKKDWRKSLAVGRRVVLMKDDGSEITKIVKYAPWQLGHGEWVIGLSGIAGGYLLSRVLRLAEAAP